MFTLAFWTGRNLIGLRKADHFFEGFTTMIAFIFVNGHETITSLYINILYPSIAYFHHLSRIIRYSESTKPAGFSLLALLGINN